MLVVTRKRNGWEELFAVIHPLVHSRPSIPSTEEMMHSRLTMANTLVVLIATRDHGHSLPWATCPVIQEDELVCLGPDTEIRVLSVCLEKLFLPDGVQRPEHTVDLLEGWIRRRRRRNDGRGLCPGRWLSGEGTTGLCCGECETEQPTEEQKIEEKRCGLQHRPDVMQQGAAEVPDAKDVSGGWDEEWMVGNFRP